MTYVLDPELAAAAAAPARDYTDVVSAREAAQAACAQRAAFEGRTPLTITDLAVVSYPAALEDSYAVLQWAFDHGHRHGTDPRRVSVFGESAGAGLAAALTLPVARSSGAITSGLRRVRTASRSRYSPLRPAPAPRIWWACRRHT